MNGNGYLSLAEVDKGLRDVIGLQCLFDAKPVIIRAFQSAKKKLKANNPHGDDYVSKAEFRFLLMYLRQYYEYWLAFNLVDTDDDRRIDLEEFTKGSNLMEKWGIQIIDPSESFDEVDTNHGGKILFKEFVEWAINKNLDLPFDDDAI